LSSARLERGYGIYWEHSPNKGTAEQTLIPILVSHRGGRRQKKFKVLRIYQGPRSTGGVVEARKRDYRLLGNFGKLPLHDFRTDTVVITTPPPSNGHSGLEDILSPSLWPTVDSAPFNGHYSARYLTTGCRCRARAPFPPDIAEDIQEADGTTDK
jgi:hypothetical protein